MKKIKMTKVQIKLEVCPRTSKKPTASTEGHCFITKRGSTSLISLHSMVFAPTGKVCIILNEVEAFLSSALVMESKKFPDMSRRQIRPILWKVWSHKLWCFFKTNFTLDTTVSDHCLLKFMTQRHSKSTKSRLIRSNFISRKFKRRVNLRLMWINQPKKIQRQKSTDHCFGAKTVSRVGHLK